MRESYERSLRAADHAPYAQHAATATGKQRSQSGAGTSAAMASMVRAMTHMVQYARVAMRRRAQSSFPG